MLPSGLLISNGERIGEREFDYQRTAFLSLSPKLEIIDTTQEKVNLEKIKEGAQSYPLLIRDGQSAIESDSELLARRSFIGTDQK